MKLQQTNNQNLEQSDLTTLLTSCNTKEICRVLTTLNCIRDNNTTPSNINAAAILIQREYGYITLELLNKIIIDGIMQKYNDGVSAQYNDIPNLLNWLRIHKRRNQNNIY